jgi:hypothetical protein
MLQVIDLLYSPNRFESTCVVANHKNCMDGSFRDLGICWNTPPSDSCPRRTMPRLVRTGTLPTGFCEGLNKRLAALNHARVTCLRSAVLNRRASKGRVGYERQSAEFCQSRSRHLAT